MIHIEPYSREKQQEWDDFIDRSKSPMFMFKRGFMEYHSDRFKDFSLMFYDEEKLVTVLPASRHSNELCSHGGLTYGGFFVAQFTHQYHLNECVNVLIPFLKAKGISSLTYKAVPYIYHTVLSEEYMFPLLQHGAKWIRADVATVVDLKNPLKVTKGRKAQISRAKRERVTIMESHDFESFIALENEVLGKYHNTTAVHTVQELKLLSDRFPGNIKLYIAEYQEQIIAGTVLFIYQNTVHTQYMAANDMARKIGGLDLLVKTLIEKYSDSKKYFDFGISCEQGGSVFNDGLCFQKESFGGRSLTYNLYRVML